MARWAVGTTPESASERGGHKCGSTPADARSLRGGLTVTAALLLVLSTMIATVVDRHPQAEIRPE